MPPVKVRFPPSPTGLLHVGSARTALYNWLWARHTGGSLVLRFEDTDRARSTDGAIDQALRVLEWLGIDWDDGPYRQTERFGFYAETAQRLIDEGHVVCSRVKHTKANVQLREGDEIAITLPEPAAAAPAIRREAPRPVRERPRRDPSAMLALPASRGSTSWRRRGRARE